MSRDAGATPAERAWKLLPLLFPLLALLLLWEVLLGGKVLLPAAYLQGMSPWNAQGTPELPQWNILQWDGMAEFYPWRLHAAREITAGRIPLWDPYVLCGTPFLANSQSAPLYPLHLLYYLPLGLSTAARLGWVAWVHLSLAGLFAFWLAREFGARPLAAALGGAAFELSGFAVAWLELPSFISVSCWIPLAMLCMIRALRLRSWRWAAGTGAVLGIMLLAGHLQVAFYGLLAVGLTWLWETAADRRQLPSALGIGLLALGIGLALAAPQMLPSIELSRISHRVVQISEEGYRKYLELAMPPQNWITLMVPDFYGLPGRGDYWGNWSYGPPNTMEYAGHVGLAVFALAGLGAMAAFTRKDRWARLLLVLALIALLLATGSPLCRVFYFFVPGFAQSGSPARSLVLLCLAQSGLAALGLELLLRRVEESSRSGGTHLSFAAIMAIAGFLLCLAVSMNPELARQPALMDISIPAAVRAWAWCLALLGGCGLLLWLLRENAPRMRSAAIGVAVLLICAGGLVWLGGPYNLTAAPTLAFPVTALTSALLKSGARVATFNQAWGPLKVPHALLPPNASIAYGWRDAQGYDSLALGRYRDLANRMASGLPGLAAPEINGNMVFIKQASPLLNLTGARYAVSQTPLTGQGYAPAPEFPSGPPYVYLNQNAVPEAYLAPRWFAADDDAGLKLLAGMRGPELQHTALVPPGSPEPSLAEPPESGLQVPVTIERPASGHIRTTTSPRVPSLLVLTEAFAPGWKARLSSGKEAEILRTNGAFQGVILEPGPNTVDWHYEPGSFRAGLFIGLAALGLLCGVAASGRRQPARV